jgi:hypothetical protein
MTIVSGEVTTAYFTKFYDGRNHLAIIDGEEAGKLIASGWKQMSVLEYRTTRELYVKLDLRKKTE